MGIQEKCAQNLCCTRTDQLAAVAEVFLAAWGRATGPSLVHAFTSCRPCMCKVTVPHQSSRNRLPVRPHDPRGVRAGVRRAGSQRSSSR